MQPMTRNRHLGRALSPILVCAIAGAADSAADVVRVPVSEVKPLLIAAVEHGEAHGQMIGPGAEAVQRHFDTGTPIEIDVRRLHALPQTGCARLEVTTRQQAVMQQGKRSDQVLTYQVSYCGSGKFPARQP